MYFIEVFVRWDTLVLQYIAQNIYFLLRVDKMTRYIFFFNKLWEQYISGEINSFNQKDMNYMYDRVEWIPTLFKK